MREGQLPKEISRREALQTLFVLSLTADCAGANIGPLTETELLSPRGREKAQVIERHKVALFDKFERGEIRDIVAALDTVVGWVGDVSRFNLQIGKMPFNQNLKWEAVERLDEDHAPPEEYSHPLLGGIRRRERAILDMRKILFD